MNDSLGLKVREGISRISKLDFLIKLHEQKGRICIMRLNMQDKLC